MVSVEYEMNSGRCLPHERRSASRAAKSDSGTQGGGLVSRCFTYLLAKLAGNL